MHVYRFPARTWFCPHIHIADRHIRCGPICNWYQGHKPHLGPPVRGRRAAFFFLGPIAHLNPLNPNQNPVCRHFKVHVTAEMLTRLLIIRLASSHSSSRFGINACTQDKHKPCNFDFLICQFQDIWSDYLFKHIDWLQCNLSLWWEWPQGENFSLSRPSYACILYMYACHQQICDLCYVKRSWLSPK